MTGFAAFASQFLSKNTGFYKLIRKTAPFSARNAAGLLDMRRGMLYNSNESI